MNYDGYSKALRYNGKKISKSLLLLSKHKIEQKMSPSKWNV